jgi:hypothetical protein
MLLVVITPILMLADYFLTLIGKRYRDKITYISSDTYELNPEFRKAIDNELKINPRHLIYVVVFTFIAFMVYKSGNETSIEGFTGFIVTLFSVVNARHIGNILLYRYSLKNPDQVKGTLYTSHEYNLKNSLFQVIGLSTVFLVFVLIKPSPFLIGAFISQLVFIIQHIAWIYTHKEQEQLRLNESWQKDEMRPK